MLVRDGTSEVGVEERLYVFVEASAFLSKWLGGRESARGSPPDVWGKDICT